MQLEITHRVEELKGRLGGSKGVRYVSSLRLVLDANEGRIVERFSLENRGLLTHDDLMTLAGSGVTAAGSDGTPSPTLSVLIHGISIACPSATSLLVADGIIAERCSSIVGVLSALAVFDEPRTISLGEVSAEMPAVALSGT